MIGLYMKRCLSTIVFFLGALSVLDAQSGDAQSSSAAAVYAGIEVGAKGVKLSLVEIDTSALKRNAFTSLKDTSVNTDFISFTEPTFKATVIGLQALYQTAVRNYHVPANKVFTVISSGVKVQAEKEDKSKWITRLIDSFRISVNEPARKVEVVDVLQEAKLSHLGIVPSSKRYNTFLIDIGSGNTKGGFFPLGNTTDFRLFNVSWGTKSTANATERRCESDKSLANYNKQLYKVAYEAENAEIIYAVNSSGSYPLSDIVEFSGGIAWSVATLVHPEQLTNPAVKVTYKDVVNFSEKLYAEYASLSDSALTGRIQVSGMEKAAIGKEIKRVHGVFDQRSLMAGTALLLKIMRQFISVYESKEFQLVKNGQVGWISAYVDQNISR